jgi:threonine/homoserine/homoserine lactone efflux protein
VGAEALPLSLPALLVSAYLVSLATVVVPGPITLVATRLALHHHTGAAALFLAGVTTLDIVLFLALAGGAAPALHLAGALPMVEIVGGIAIIWAGVGSMRGAIAPHRHSVHPRVIERRYLGHFFLGIAVSAANPQYWIWWVTAGLAFVQAAARHGADGLTWLLVALIAGVVSWYVPLLVALQRGRALLSPRAEHLVVRGLGVVMIALGVALVVLGLRRL